MRKKIIPIVTIAIAATVTAGCSIDTTRETNSGIPISFRGHTEALTRGSETTIDGLDRFWVVALNEGTVYFSDEFTREDGNSYYVSEMPHFWPSGADQLDFLAYSPDASSLGGTLTYDGTEKKLSGFVPASDVSFQKDFIYAQTTVSAADATSGIQLSFKHALSQVGIMAKSANTSYDYSVKGVKVVNVGSEGSFSFSDGLWSLADGKAAEYAVAEYSEPLLLEPSAKNLMGTGGNMMIIPQQLKEWGKTSLDGVYIAVQIQITAKESGEKVFPETEEYGWACVSIGGTDKSWVPGRKYLYTLDFTNGAGMDENGDIIFEGPIKFEVVSLDGWIEISDTPDVQ